MNIAEVVKQFNTTRRANKNKWFSISTTINGIPVQYKAYNTWVQQLEALRPDGRQVITGSNMDLSVKYITMWLTDTLEYIIKE